LCKVNFHLGWDYQLFHTDFNNMVLSSLMIIIQDIIILDEHGHIHSSNFGFTCLIILLLSSGIIMDMDSLLLQIHTVCYSSESQTSIWDPTILIMEFMIFSCNIRPPFIWNHMVQIYYCIYVVTAFYLIPLIMH
jgi:hypothetical protein